MAQEIWIVLEGDDYRKEIAGVFNDQETAEKFADQSDYTWVEKWTEVNDTNRFYRLGN